MLAWMGSEKYFLPAMDWFEVRSTKVLVVDPVPPWAIDRTPVNETVGDVDPARSTVNGLLATSWLPRLSVMTCEPPEQDPALGMVTARVLMLRHACMVLLCVDCGEAYTTPDTTSAEAIVTPAR